MILLHDKYLACVSCLMHVLQVIQNLKGHFDYSFASAWHPDGHVLATGNQDTTCRLWDVRNLSESFAVLKGRMGAIRGIKFSSDGRFMAMAEPADFIHVFDTKSDYSMAQEIDLFGEIAGVSFSPDTEALFVGVSDRTYGSLVEFNRRRRNEYMDSFL
uniref:Putative WD repeat-containing protein C2A9.03 n=1 Tax=Anthurium amnicola TaxID=1678845 RepID=A0A1D1XFW1_9ARAE